MWFWIYQFTFMKYVLLVIVTFNEYTNVRENDVKMISLYGDLR